MTNGICAGRSFTPNLGRNPGIPAMALAASGRVDALVDDDVVTIALLGDVAAHPVLLRAVPHRSVPMRSDGPLRPVPTGAASCRSVKQDQHAFTPLATLSAPMASNL
jgi:hypothetical protein